MGPGGGLCYRDDVEQLVVCYPTVVFYSFALYERYHGIPAAKGECAYFQKGKEQLSKSAPADTFGFFLFIFQYVASLFGSRL